MSSVQSRLRSHGPFGDIHLDNAYAQRANWTHGWSPHYNKVVECRWDHVVDPPLAHKDRSHLHKALHMGMGRCHGEFLQAIVETEAWVPLPIPGSMMTDLSLRKSRRSLGTAMNRLRHTS